MPASPAMQVVSDILRTNPAMLRSNRTAPRRSKQNPPEFLGFEVYQHQGTGDLANSKKLTEADWDLLHRIGASAVGADSRA